jgi:triacylglycerol lipase
MYPSTWAHTSTGSVKERAEQMHKYLSDTLPIGTGVNFVAHSMGGLDVRHLISNIKPTRYTPLTLTTIGTPHRGSPFMDWCAANIGLGSASQAASKAISDATKGLPYSLKSPLLAAEVEGTSGLAGFTNAMTRYLLNIFDSPAYANLTTSFCRDFNPETPDDPRVKYVSVAGRTSKMSVLHPLWFPKLVLDAAAEKGYPPDDSGKDYEGNDGLVSVKSAKWGEFLGAVDDTHHWDLRGEGGLWPNGLGGDEPAKGKGKKDSKEVEESANNKSDEVIMPGGWDWDDSIHEYLGLDLTSAKEKIGLGSADSKKDAAKSAQQDKEASGKSGNEGWAATQAANAAQAQVGQLIDWVTDVLPGSQSTEAGKKRIQDAKDENKRERGGTRRKEGEKDKFDLARFYGGLMLKLRDEGY